MSRDFDLSDVLSIVPGQLVSTRHVEGVYDILNYMTGDNLMTHQLPRAARACEGPLIEQHPWLADVHEVEWSTPAEGRAEEVAAYVAEMKRRHGDTVTVTPLADWHRMDPIQELAEMTERPDRIIAVQI